MTYEEASELVPFTAEIEAALVELALSRAPVRLAKLASAASEDERFDRLPRAAAAAFHLGLHAEARAHAEESLALAPRHPAAWNHGNAVHLGNTVLGLLALRDGAHPHEAAVAALLASAATSGSPQLVSFGPTMQLAKALLREGQAVPVLDYLMRCRRFWPAGEAWLGIWERKIGEGQVPNFFEHALM